IAAAGYYLSLAILSLLGAPGDAAPMALAYVRVIFLAMPALLLLTLLMMALRGGGDSLTPWWFMIGAVVRASPLHPTLVLRLGPGQCDYPRRGRLCVADYRRPDRHPDARRQIRAGLVHGRRQPGVAHRPPHPFACDLEFPAVRRDHGDDCNGPRQWLGLGPA